MISSSDLLSLKIKCPLIYHARAGLCVVIKRMAFVMTLAASRWPGVMLAGIGDARLQRYPRVAILHNRRRKHQRRRVVLCSAVLAERDRRAYAGSLRERHLGVASSPVSPAGAKAALSYDSRRRRRLSAASSWQALRAEAAIVNFRRSPHI